MRSKILAALTAVVLTGGLAACQLPLNPTPPPGGGGAAEPNFFFLLLGVHIYDCRGALDPVLCDNPIDEVVGEIGGSYVVSALAPPDENGEPRTVQVHNKTTGQVGDSPQTVQVDRYPTNDEQHVQEGMLWVRWDIFVDRVATNWRVVCDVRYADNPEVVIPQMFGVDSYFNEGPITTTGHVTCSWPVGVSPV